MAEVLFMSMYKHKVMDTSCIIHVYIYMHVLVYMCMDTPSRPIIAGSERGTVAS